MSEGAAAPPPAANRAEQHYEARRLVKVEKLKDAVGELTRQRDEITRERDKALKQVEDIKSKSDNSALAKQNAELQQQLRVIRHRQVLDRVATEKGLNPAAVDAFYKLSEYEAKGDEVDEAEVGAFVDAKKAEIPYLFGTATQTEGKSEKLVKPAVGSGYSGAPQMKTKSQDVMIIGENDPRMSDAVWQMLNQDKLVASAQERLARGEI